MPAGAPAFSRKNTKGCMGAVSSFGSSFRLGTYYRKGAGGVLLRGWGFKVTFFCGNPENGQKQ